MALDGRSAEALEAEEQRMRAVYARRATRASSPYTFFDPGNLFTVQKRERTLLAVLKRHNLTPLAARKCLEVGCGGGYWLSEFVRWGARPENMTGIELLESRVEEARRRCPAKVSVDLGNAARLCYPDEWFDMVLQFTTFSSILDDSVKTTIAGEMLRVLKPHGVIVWYDMCVNNPRNPDVRAIGKRGLKLLFPQSRICLRRVTLAPPIARRIAPYCWPLCELLEMLPLLRTHYVALVWKTAPS